MKRLRAYLNDLEARRPCAYAWTAVVVADGILFVLLIVAKPFAN